MAACVDMIKNKWFQDRRLGSLSPPFNYLACDEEAMD